MFNHSGDVFIPMIALLVNVVSQVIGFRFFLKSGLLVSIFLGFIAGFFVFAFFDLFRRNSAAVFLVHLLTYGSFGYCYFHFINLGETARRIRILRELKSSPDGLSLDELLKNYNAQEIIERRLRRLINNGQLKVRNDRYYIGKPAMLGMAKILVGLKYLLLGKRSGFD